jgi:hypothetical protein
MISGFLLFLIFLDTGGWLHVRSFILSWLFLKALNLSISKYDLYFLKIWLVVILLLIPSILNAKNQGIDLLTSITYIYPLLIFPIYLLAAKNINSKDLVNCAMYFSIFIISLFILSFLNVSLINTFIDYLNTQKNAGFFSVKSSFFIFPMQVIYFKATLLLVPLAILAVFQERWVVFLLIIGALIIAPSRTGVIFIVIFLFFYFSKFNLKFIFLLLIVITLTVSYLIENSSSDLVVDFFFSGSTRMLHIDSLFDYFKKNPNYFFFGGGPGSFFYSEGFMLQESLGYTDDSEISQLEVLRRYGVFFMLFLHIIFFNIVKKLFKNSRQDLAISLIAYYLVSASNPVLLTAPAVLFYAIILRELKTSIQQSNKIKILCLAKSV